MSRKPPLEVRRSSVTRDHELHGPHEQAADYPPLSVPYTEGIRAPDDDVERLFAESQHRGDEAHTRNDAPYRTGRSAAILKYKKYMPSTLGSWVIMRTRTRSMRSLQNGKPFSVVPQDRRHPPPVGCIVELDCQNSATVSPVSPSGSTSGLTPRVDRRRGVLFFFREAAQVSLSTDPGPTNLSCGREGGRRQSHYCENGRGGEKEERRGKDQ